jgi:hypothetical protein
MSFFSLHDLLGRLQQICIFSAVLAIVEFEYIGICMGKMLKIVLAPISKVKWLMSKHFARPPTNN